MPVLAAVVGTQKLSGSTAVHCGVDDVVADLAQEVLGACLRFRPAGECCDDGAHIDRGCAGMS